MPTTTATTRTPAAAPVTGPEGPAPILPHDRDRANAARLVRGPLVACRGTGNTQFETRTVDIIGTVLALCTDCGRVLKPTPTGKLRRHQPRNRHTYSLDITRDILWDYAGRR